jgi:putative ABC transport system permease protein
VDMLSSLRPEKIPDSAVIRVDLGVLLFSLGISMLTGLLFGVVPALQAARADIGEVLKDADQRTATGGRRHGRTRNVLVVAEVALALVLLVGAGLTVRAFAALSRVDPGFVADDAVTMAVTLSTNDYGDSARVQAYRDRLRTDLEAIPGVAHATLSSGMPMAGASESSYGVDGEEIPPGAAEHFAVYYPVDGAFAETMRLHLIAGRFIRDDDRQNQPKVVVIDEHLARTRFGGVDPIGKRLDFFGGKREIIGVVGHVVSYGLGETEAAEDQIYLSWQQLPPEWFAAINRGVQITLRARPGIDPTTLVAPATAAVQAIDSNQPVYEVQTLHKLLDGSVAARRFTMMLLGIFSVLALILAVVGLYSVMSYLVAQRRQEVGIRMALGARPQDVLRLVVGQGLAVTGIGLVIGTIASFLLAGVMSSLLYGVQPTDPLTFIGVAGILLVAATVATWLPARRASRIDPMVALRNEG